jgi:hypothetical protein
MSIELPPRPRMPWQRLSVDKRRRRIERELRALYAMRSHLTTWQILCAVLTIPAFGLLCLLVGWKLHLLSGSVPLAVAIALAGGAAIWWIGRYWFALAALIVFAICIVAVEGAPIDTPDLSGLDFSDPATSKSKAGRRAKLDRAIARREQMLGKDAPKS